MKQKIIALITAFSIAMSMCCYLPATVFTAQADSPNDPGTITLWLKKYELTPNDGKKYEINNLNACLETIGKDTGIKSTNTYALGFFIQISGIVYVGDTLNLKDFRYSDHEVTKVYIFGDGTGATIKRYDNCSGPMFDFSGSDIELHLFNINIDGSPSGVKKTAPDSNQINEITYNMPTENTLAVTPDEITDISFDSIEDSDFSDLSNNDASSDIDINDISSDTDINDLSSDTDIDDISSNTIINGTSSALNEEEISSNLSEEKGLVNETSSTYPDEEKISVIDESDLKFASNEIVQTDPATEPMTTQKSPIIRVHDGATLFVENNPNDNDFGVEIGNIKGSVTISNAADTAVYVDKNGTFNMKEESKIEKCTAENGGAVYINGGTFEQSGGTVTGNTATENGGAVYITNNGTFEQSGGTITGNTATENGGAIYIDNGTFKQSSGIISGNGENTDNTAALGGGVYINNGTFEQSGGSITGNKAENGGGVYIGGGIVTLSDNGTITNNTSTQNGGGVYVNGGTFKQSGGTIGSSEGSTANTAVLGGGVYISGDGVFTLSDNGSIANNTTTENGGGVYIGGGTFNLYGGVIGEDSDKISESNANKARSGGGVYYAGGVFNLHGKPVVLGNSVNNVVLAEGKKITIDGEADTDVKKVGVCYSDGNKGIFTSGWKKNNKSKHLVDKAAPPNIFKSDNKRYDVSLNPKAEGNIPKESEAAFVDKFHVHSPCGLSCEKISTSDAEFWDGEKVNWQAFKTLGYHECEKHGHDNNADVLEKLGINTKLVEFQKIEEAGEFKSSGNFYLRNDLTLNTTIDITGNFTLCLNGNTLIIGEGGGFEVKNGANFALCDCYSDECIENQEATFPLESETEGKVVVNGNQTFVTNSGTGTVTLYKGTITEGTAVKLTNSGNLTIEDAVLNNSNIDGTAPEGADTKDTGTITIKRRAAYGTDKKTIDGGEINAPNYNIVIESGNDKNVITDVNASRISGADITITNSTVNKDETASNCAISGKTVAIKQSSIVKAQSVSADDITITESTVNTNAPINANNSVSINENSDVTGDVTGKKVTINGGIVNGKVTVGNVSGDSLDGLDGQFISGTINGQLILQGDSESEVGTFTVNSGEDTSIELAENAKLYLYDNPTISSIKCKSTDAPGDTQIFGESYTTKTNGEKTPLSITEQTSNRTIILNVDSRVKNKYAMQRVPVSQVKFFDMQPATFSGDGLNYDAFYLGLKDVNHNNVDNSCDLKIVFSLYIGDDLPERIIEKTPFLDANFRAYLRDLVVDGGTKADKNGNQYLDEEEIATVKEIILTGTDVKDLSGIRYFHQNLAKIDITGLEITTDDLWNNEFKNNDKPLNALTSLICNSCTFKGNIDVSELPELNTLKCSGVTVGTDKLETLDVTNNTNLVTLDCSDNRLTSLDVRQNPALVTLNCSSEPNTADHNNIAALDVSNNKALITLDCSNNAIKNLILTYNTALETLNCSQNDLSDDLDLTKNTSLKKINCSNQKGDPEKDERITEIKFNNSDETPHTLEELDCSNNNLYYLNLMNVLSLTTTPTVNANGNYYVISSCLSHTLNPLGGENGSFADGGSRLNVDGAVFNQNTGEFTDFNYHEGYNGHIRYTYNTGAANISCQFELKYYHKGDCTYDKNGKPATCTDDQVPGGHKCSACGKLFLGHVDHKDENGNDLSIGAKGDTSPIFYDYVDEQNLDKAHGHKWTYVPEELATCESDGHRGYYKCTCLGEDKGCCSYSTDENPVDVWFISDEPLSEDELEKYKYLKRGQPAEGEIQPIHVGSIMVPLNDGSGGTRYNDDLWLDHTKQPHFRKTKDENGNVIKNDYTNYEYSEGLKYPTCITNGHVDNYECLVCHEHFNKTVQDEGNLQTEPIEALKGEALRDKQDKFIISESTKNDVDILADDKKAVIGRCQQIGYELMAFGHNWGDAITNDATETRYGYFSKSGTSEAAHPANCVDKGTWAYWYCGNCGHVFVNRHLTVPYRDEDDPLMKYGYDEGYYTNAANTVAVVGPMLLVDEPFERETITENPDQTHAQGGTKVKIDNSLSGDALKDDIKAKVACVIEEVNLKNHKESSSEPHHVDPLNDICDEYGLYDYYVCKDCHLAYKPRQNLKDSENRAAFFRTVTPVQYNGENAQFFKAEGKDNNYALKISDDTSVLFQTIVDKCNTAKTTDNLTDDESSVQQALTGADIWREPGEHWNPFNEEYFANVKWYSESDDPLHHYYICPNPNCGKKIHHSRYDCTGKDNCAADNNTNHVDWYVHAPVNGNSYIPDNDNETHHHYLCSLCKDNDSATQNHLVQKTDDMSEEVQKALHVVCLFGAPVQIEGDNEHHRITCSECKRDVYKEHNFGEFRDTSEKAHTKTCTDCGYTISEEHTYDGTFETDEVGHYQICTVATCQHQKRLADHSFVYQEGNETDSEKHKLVCNFTLNDEKCEATKWENHNFGEAKYDESDPNHITHHYYQCEVCDYKKYESHSGHNIIKDDDHQPDEEGHWTSCEVCEGDFVKEPHTGNNRPMNEYDNDYSLENYLKYHIIACDTEGCGYSGKGLHVWEDHPEVEPNCTENGTKAYSECTICGLKVYKDSDGNVTEAVPSEEDLIIHKLGHQWSEGNKDKWEYSVDLREHYQKCERCGEIVTDDPEHYHIYDPELVRSDDESGHELQCAKCNFTQTVAHQVNSEWKTGEETTNDVYSAYHYNECIGTDTDQTDTEGRSLTGIADLLQNIKCGCELNKAEHKPSGNIVNKEDDEFHYDKCTVCEYEYKIPHTYRATNTDGYEWDNIGSQNLHSQECTECHHIRYEAHDIWDNADIDEDYHIGKCDKCGANINGKHGEWIYVPITNAELDELNSGKGWDIMSRTEAFADDDSAYSREYHKKICGICGFYTADEHKEDEGVWVPNGDGLMHHKECKFCHYEFSDPQVHNDYRWVYDDTRNTDSHYLVCGTCGEEIKYHVDITHSFGSSYDGNPIRHSFINDDGSIDYSQEYCADCHKPNPDYKPESDSSSDAPDSSNSSDNSSNNGSDSNSDDSSDSSSDISSGDSSSSTPNRPTPGGESSGSGGINEPDSSSDSDSSSNPNSSGGSDGSNSSNGSDGSDTSNGSDSSNNSNSSEGSNNSNSSDNRNDSDSFNNSNGSGNSNGSNGSGNSNGSDGTGTGVDTSDFEGLIITDSAVDVSNVSGVHGNIYKVVRCSTDAPSTLLNTPLDELVDILATRDDLAAVKDNATDLEFLLTVVNADRTVSISDRRITEGVVSRTDDRIGQYLDISLYKLLGYERWQIHKTDKELRIQFNIPDRLLRLSPQRDFSVLRIHEGVPTFLNDLDTNPDTITIDTDSFSTYVILYNGDGTITDGTGASGQDNRDNPNTGVASITVVPTVLAAITVFTTAKRDDE